MNIIGNPALLIIDAQKGFLSDPNGPAAVYDAWTAVDNISLVLNAARKAKIPVIHSQEMHRKQMVDFGRELDGSEGVHCLEGTESVEIVDELKPIEGEYIIQKRRYSCFFATDLNILLKGLNVQSLLVCGFLTDVCVHYTCADAHQHDYHVKVLYDCVRGSSLESHEASLKAIKYLQTSSESSKDEFIQHFSVLTKS
ncbi:cysteine hydrolase family protein [Cohnella silvisoli]|uniref:Isochorismatase family cysteine hydrolase n=1 Tax=Cohnella silvisoli TaxID=2873699 RepID=A0ABV1KT92_9BACL|nr:isochorismatase family cysteine hydrolase [Cohnella silvisoli]MCD9022955.1 cysteine hydrolase [Cohnella silvisoli]